MSKSTLMETRLRFADVAALLTVCLLVLLPFSLFAWGLQARLVERVSRLRTLSRLLPADQGSPGSGWREVSASSAVPERIPGFERVTVTLHTTPDALRVELFSRYELRTSAEGWVREAEPALTPARWVLTAGSYLFVIRYGENVVRCPFEAGWQEPLLLQVPVPAQWEEGMVFVPPGPCWLGSEEVAEERPLRRVECHAFWIDRHEVTNRQYAAFVSETGLPPPPHWEGRRPPEARLDHPVTHVSWEEAQAYAKWAGKRLPTEKEWERAARGSDRRRWPWGDFFPEQAANTREAGRRETSPVGSFPLDESPFGCCDMGGNAAEWVDDWYGRYPGNSETSCYYGFQFRVSRGGTYAAEAEQARVTNRRRELPTYRNAATQGFRCAKNAE